METAANSLHSNSEQNQDELIRVSGEALVDILRPNIPLGKPGATMPLR